MVKIGSNHVGANQQDVRLIAVATIQKGPAAGSLLGKAKFFGLLSGRDWLASIFLLRKAPAVRLQKDRRSMIGILAQKA
jgi:hypothetical protein